MAISEAERIKRAEELYYKRRYNQNYRGSSRKEKKKKHSFIRWFIGKTIYALLIIACVYGYNNKEYILSDEFKEDFNNFIKTPIDFDKLINNFYTNSNENVDNSEEKSANDSKGDENDDTKINIIDSNIVNEKTEEISKKTTSQEILKTTNIKTKDMSVEEYIKSVCSFIKPIEAKVTSRYGKRSSKYKNVSKNHTGIDLAANVGTDIVSSIDGKVIEVSSEGNYGKHLKIESKNDKDIIILYAHCSKILVKKGDNVKKNQVVAKVGNTGNTTGAHLHFEIRYKDDYINPEKIMEF